MLIFSNNLNLNQFQVVYKYVRKTNRGSWSDDDIEKVIQEAALGCLNAAALKYNIPYAAIYNV
jgi:hypothetical protein